MNASNPPLGNKKDWPLQATIFAIIGMGIILPASKYLPGWSMRGDELVVTLNLINRSALDLITKPLDSEQAAPIGFLLLEKLLLTLFHNHLIRETTKKDFLELGAFGALAICLSHPALFIVIATANTYLVTQSYVTDD